MKHVAEIMKIMQASGATCFPCSSPDGFLGTLFKRFRKDDTPWGRIHLQPHPVMAAELAQFFQDVVLYVNAQCVIESLTLGPRECRLPLDELPALNEVPWMNYWRQSAQNPSGLTDRDIKDEEHWQREALKMNAEEGCVVPSRVHSTQGRTANLNIIHVLSKRQFRNTPVHAGANVTVLEAAINAEKRDRQTDLDQMMLKETERHMFWLGRNMGFRHGVEGGIPVIVPWGPPISTTAYEFAGAPDLERPQSSTTLATEVPPNETQAPAVEPWPNTGPPEPNEMPPPPVLRCRLRVLMCRAALRFAL